MSNEYYFLGEPNICLTFEKDCVKVTASKSDNKFPFERIQSLNVDKKRLTPKEMQPIINEEFMKIYGGLNEPS